MEATYVREIRIPSGSEGLEGELRLPGGALGVVLFAHGSGSSRLSARDRYVAELLAAGGLGTLQFNMLSEEETLVDALTQEMRFDLDLMTDRLRRASEWLAEQPETAGRPFGILGEGTGASAALRVAAMPDSRASAVVSCGGRPDLAEESLESVRAPVLLIVGSEDEPILLLNREAAYRLRCDNRLVTVPGVGHLLSEPGAPETVAEHAGAWFRQYFGAVDPGG